MADKKLYSPNTIKEIMNKYGFKFSKKLGQNFLIDGNIISSICDNSEITESDGVIEIGPGIGVLTYELCKRAKKVVAIELDKSLIPVLEDNMAEFDNFSLIQGDVLNVDLGKLIEDEFKGLNVKVVANLPYYITTPIIMKLLEEKLDIDKIVVMVQKEVADRLSSSPGSKDYGAITIAVQYYSDANTIVKVPNTVFMPRPNVDSAVIALDIHREPRISVKDEKLMFKIVKAAFGQRRKTVLNAVGALEMGISKEELREVLEECNIDPRRRGETFSIEEFAMLSDRLGEKVASKA
jgi:16S rRNA (adenine1518-N6/adenine1519-N6)-dimethyltransferase